MSFDSIFYHPNRAGCFWEMIRMPYSLQNIDPSSNNPQSVGKTLKICLSPRPGGQSLPSSMFASFIGPWDALSMAFSTFRRHSNSSSMTGMTASLMLSLSTMFLKESTPPTILSALPSKSFPNPFSIQCHASSTTLLMPFVTFSAHSERPEHNPFTYFDQNGWRGSGSSWRIWSAQSKKFTGNQQVTGSKQDLGTQHVLTLKQDFGTEHVLGLKHDLATWLKSQVISRSVQNLLRRRVWHISSTDSPQSAMLVTISSPHFSTLVTTSEPQAIASVTHFLPHSTSSGMNSFPHFSASLIIFFPHFTGSGAKHKQYWQLEPLRPLWAREVPMFSSDASSMEHVCRAALAALAAAKLRSSVWLKPEAAHRQKARSLSWPVVASPRWIWSDLIRSAEKSLDFGFFGSWKQACSAQNQRTWKIMQSLVRQCWICMDLVSVQHLIDLMFSCSTSRVKYQTSMFFHILFTSFSPSFSSSLLSSFRCSPEPLNVSKLSRQSSASSPEPGTLTGTAQDVFGAPKWWKKVENRWRKQQVTGDRWKPAPFVISRLHVFLHCLLLLLSLRLTMP